MKVSRACARVAVRPSFAELVAAGKIRLARRPRFEIAFMVVASGVAG